VLSVTSALITLSDTY